MYGTNTKKSLALLFTTLIISALTLYSTNIPQILETLRSDVAPKISSELTASTPTLSDASKEVLLDAAAKVSPAVVSISISKYEPVLAVTYEHEQAHDPYLGDIDIVIPRYTKVGTRLEVIGAGSGIALSHNGHILTNKHVVSEPEAVYTVLLPDGSTKEAKVVYRDPDFDAAVIRVDAALPSVASFGNSALLKKNEPVAAIGNAYGKYSNVVSTGAVVGFNRNIIAQGGDLVEKLQGLIELDAPIAPGYSGGPLINLEGKVVGINVAKDVETNTSFSIPINSIYPRIADYLK